MSGLRWYLAFREMFPIIRGKQNVSSPLICGRAAYSRARDKLFLGFCFCSGSREEKSAFLLRERAFPCLPFLLSPMATWCICFLRLTPLREIHYATAASFKVSNFLARVRFFKLSHVRLAFRSSFLELEKVNWVIKSKDSRTQRDSPGNPFPSLKPFQASNRSFCLGLIWLSKLWKNSSLFWAWRSFPTRKFVFLVHFNRIDQTFSTKANISKPNH